MGDDAVTPRQPQEGTTEVPLLHQMKNHKGASKDPKFEWVCPIWKMISLCLGATYQDLVDFLQGLLDLGNLFFAIFPCLQNGQRLVKLSGINPVEVANGISTGNCCCLFSR